LIKKPYGFDVGLYLLISAEKRAPNWKASQ